MSIKNKTPEQLVLDFFAKVWGGGHDLHVIDEMMAEDYIITSGGVEIRGRENFKAWVKNFHQVLHNATTISEEVFANTDGNKVVSRWVCSGINNGIFGLPADGKKVSFTGIAIWKVKEGKLAECWVERSAFELYKLHTVK